MENIQTDVPGCKGSTKLSLTLIWVFCFILILGGLFIFSIRADSFDPKELGYSTKFEELEKLGKWSLVNRELRELYSNPCEERYRNCYLITYKVLKNWPTSSYHSNFSQN